MSALTDIRNRGTRDVFFLVCDGLKGLPEVVEHVWPATTVQTCVVHLIRNTFRLSGRQHWDALKHDLRPIYTAPTEAAAQAALDELAEHWGQKYPAIIRLWTNAWQEFIPFLDYDTEIRRVLCSTNAIESLNGPLSAGGESAGSFPYRGRCAEMPLPGDAFTRPDGQGPCTMDNEVEAYSERVCDHVR
ncbi:Transposase, Mutator family [Rhodococcus qingshengii]|nr:Transposase, Mutator family [Rhodococcus qingshengii]